MNDAAGETTIDAYLGGRITLVQPRKGHRAGLDAALLQSAIPADASGLAVDLGTGTGAVAFSVAARAPGLRVVGVDYDQGVLNLGLQALAMPENGDFADRVRLLRADIAAFGRVGTDTDFASGSADWALMNPPFDSTGTVRASPDGRKRRAYVTEPGSLEIWIAAALATLKPRGHLALIHRAAALPRILVALQSSFGDIRVLPVLPRGDEPAKRVLLRATSQSRAPFCLLPPLLLHGADGAWTAEANEILSGRTAIAF